MITGEHIRQAPLHKVHRDTIERWGVSYDRLASLINVMDYEYKKIKFKTMTEAIRHLKVHSDMTKEEAVCMIQLYYVIKKKTGIMLN